MRTILPGAAAAVMLITALGTTEDAAAQQPPETVDFAAQTIDDEIEIGYGVAVGDVDGDDRPDVLLADKRAIVWYRNPGERNAEWSRHVMAENLTAIDNVCIAARDINGDGQVEVAVGARWNPGETEDPERSGAVFYLHRPSDPTEPWQPTQIEPHDPTTHRMRWVNIGDDEYRLAVLPLHGIGNDPGTGEGDPVRLQIVTPPDDLASGEWESEFVDTGLNRTHNLELMEVDDMPAGVMVVGQQGITGVAFNPFEEEWTTQGPLPFSEPGGEVRMAAGGDWHLIATIEPMHGNSAVAYFGPPDADEPTRHVLDDTLNAGHALAAVDLLGLGRPQIVAGWRMPDDDNRVGIRMYAPVGEEAGTWRTYTIDDNTMAAEDLQVADFDEDGRRDIVASGRATRNLIIYWNDNEHTD